MNVAIAAIPRGSERFSGKETLDVMSTKRMSALLACFVSRAGIASRPRGWADAWTRTGGGGGARGSIWVSLQVFFVSKVSEDVLAK